MATPTDLVYTPEDLERQSFADPALAVLGHPVDHSISPAMHNAALAEMALSDTRFATWRYFKFDVAPDDLPRTLERFHARGFLGVNLTVPHKVIAFGHVAEIDAAARPIGAVNTLLRLPRGWRGYNTDGHGLATAVREELGATLAGAAVVLLGAGGAARAAAVECLQRGCSSLWISNRTPARLDALLPVLHPLAAAVRLQGFDPLAPPRDLPAGALVINATSLGLRPNDPPPIDLARLPRPAGVFDMIYTPAKTALLRAAAALGVPHADGLSMLVHQGARALEIWSAARVPVAAMQRAARQALGWA